MPKATQSIRKEMDSIELQIDATSSVDDLALNLIGVTRNSIEDLHKKFFQL